MGKHEFVVTGIGMSTAVGWDAPSSCASFRAGISRAAELDYIDYFSEEEAEVVPIVGHVASSRGLECEGLAKMTTLGIDALKDLFENRDQLREKENATGLFLALPNYSLRQESFIDLNEATATIGDSNQVFSEESDDDDSLISLRFALDCNRYLRERLFRAAGVDANITLSRNTYGGHASFLTCVREAMLALRSRTVDRCIVGGIDSFLEPDTLEWALAKGRLKTPSTPCGFAPGEAAVFLEIMQAERVSSSTSVAAYLTEPDLINSGNSSSGPGLMLARVIQAAFARAPESIPDLFIGDLNGEYARALEWGYAVNRLIRKYPTFKDIRLWHPAEAFGETGCASAGLAIGVGVQAFRRKHALSQTILVWCSSEDDSRGALLLHAPN